MLICVKKPIDGLKHAEPPEDFFLLIHHGAVGSDEFVDFFLLAAEAFDDLHALDVFRERENQLIDQFAVVQILRPHGARKDDRPRSTTAA